MTDDVATTHRKYFTNASLLVMLDQARSIME